MHYTTSHEWVKDKEDIATIGISDFAQNELGDIVYIELPDIGQKVRAGKEMVVLESTKAAADVYAPVSGEIVAVNQQLKDKPELINEEPEGDAWLVKIKMTDRAELKNLMSDEEYEEFTEGK